MEAGLAAAQKKKKKKANASLRRRKRDDDDDEDEEDEEEEEEAEEEVSFVGVSTRGMSSSRREAFRPPVKKAKASQASQARRRRKHEEDEESEPAPPEELVGTIDFETGKACSSVRSDGSPWSSHRSGEMSARLDGGVEPCRLVGTVRLTFSSEKADKEWKWLSRPLKPSRRDKCSAHRLGVETFNRDGDPGFAEPGVQCTVSRLCASIEAGRLVPEETPWALSFLEALDANQRPSNIERFKAPVFRTICKRVGGGTATTTTSSTKEKTKEKKEKKRRRQASSSSSAAAAQQQQQQHGNNGKSYLTLDVSVYATRLLFYMIANESLKAVFDHVRPAAEVVEVASPPEKASPALFASTTTTTKEAFTLEGVMRAAEHAGGPEMQQPPEIALEMKPYQRMGLRWMCAMEDLDLNAMFWQKRAFLTSEDEDQGDRFYWYAPDLGECRLEKPPSCSGGVLADEMGLGKTLESVALICARKKQRPVPEEPLAQEATTGQGDDDDHQGRDDQGRDDQRLVLSRSLLSRDRDHRENTTTTTNDQEDQDSDDDSEAQQSPDFWYVKRRNRWVRRHGGAKTAAEKDAAASKKEKSRKTPQKKTVVDSRATLVIVPPALASQWREEIVKSTTKDALRIAGFVTETERRRWTAPFERSRRFGSGGGDAANPATTSKVRALRSLADHDVVITTYNVINGFGIHNTHSTHKVLSSIRWHRLLLDEMQYVASPNTQLARRCAALEASHRWMVSGTPLSDSIDDLHGELRFLGIWPFSLSDAADGFWDHCVRSPWHRRDPEALERLDLLLGRVALRRSKAQTWAPGTFLEGKPILDLPPRRDRLVALKPTITEGRLLGALEAYVASVIGNGVAAQADLCLKLIRQATVSTRAPLVQDRDVDLLCRLHRQRADVLRGGGVLTTRRVNHDGSVDANGVFPHLLRGPSSPEGFWDPDNPLFPAAAAAAGESGGRHDPYSSEAASHLIDYQVEVMSPSEAIATLAARDASQNDRRNNLNGSGRAGGATLGGGGRGAPTSSSSSSQAVSSQNKIVTRTVDDFVGHGREDVATARASTRVLSTLAVSQRLAETAALCADLEERRATAKRSVRDAVFKWILLRFALGRNDDLLTSDVPTSAASEADADLTAAAGVRDEAAIVRRLREAKAHRRRTAFAWLLLESKDAKAKLKKHLQGALTLRGGKKPLECLRFLWTTTTTTTTAAPRDEAATTAPPRDQGDSSKSSKNNGPSSSKNGGTSNPVESLFGWQEAEKLRRQASDVVGEIQLQLLSVKQQLRRLEASVVDLRKERDQHQRRGDDLFRRCAELRGLRGASATTSNDGVVTAALRAVDEADAALDDAEANPSCRDVERSKARLAFTSAVEALKLAQATERGGRLDVVVVNSPSSDASSSSSSSPSSSDACRARAVALKAVELELVDAATKARAAHRRARRAAEQLGADATEEQKRAFAELQARKPPEDADRQAKADWRAEERTLKQSLPVEALHFLFAKAAATAAETQLQFQVTQQGYKDLGRLEDPRERPAFKCPVCFTHCDYEYDPAAEADDDGNKRRRHTKKKERKATSATSLCFTSCLHSLCLGCAQQQTLTTGIEQTMRTSYNQSDDQRRRCMELANQGRINAPCVICRRPYKLLDCVVVARPRPRPNAATTTTTGEEDDRGDGGGGGGDAESKGSDSREEQDQDDDDDDDGSEEMAGKKMDAEEDDDDDADAPPVFRATASVEAALSELVDLEGASTPTNRWVTPNIPMAVHTYLQAVREQARSTKVAALLSDVAAVLAANGREKVVVFTSLRPAVDHVSAALTAAGIGNTCLVTGNSTALTRAVQTWKENDDVNVLVVHAGSAAAGVTLTAARWLFILEPFMSAGEEAQAKNRCHRIGQDRDVTTVTYFLKNTIEERLLAYRHREATTDDDDDDNGDNALSVLATPGDSRSMSTAKLRFLVGLENQTDRQRNHTLSMVIDDLERALDGY